MCITGASSVPVLSNDASRNVRYQAPELSQSNTASRYVCQHIHPTRWLVPPPIRTSNRFLPVSSAPLLQYLGTRNVVVKAIYYYMRGVHR